MSRFTDGEELERLLEGAMGGDLTAEEQNRLGDEVRRLQEEARLCDEHHWCAAYQQVVRERDEALAVLDYRTNEYEAAIRELQGERDLRAGKIRSEERG